MSLFRGLGLRSRLPFAVIAVTGTLIATACTDSRTPTRPLSPGTAGHLLTHQDSVQLGYFQKKKVLSPSDPTCDPATGNCPTLVSADPASLFQGFDQPGPVTLNFSGLVGSVSVVGDGAIECSGSYGTLIGYDANGVELGRVDLQLIDPSDCSPPDNPDNVTYGATATLVTSAVMTRAVITPMSPLSFPVLTLTGHASATYSVSLGKGPLLTPVVACSPSTLARGDSVACVTSVPGATSFTILEKRGKLGSYVVFDSTADSVWAGPAIDNTTVTVTVRADLGGTQQTVSGVGQFTVTPRIWPRLNFATAAPPLTYDSASHLTGRMPGIIVAALGSGKRDSFPDGGLGANVGDYKEDSNGLTDHGPNKNVYYRKTPPVFFPESVFIRTSLVAGNPFYVKQSSAKKLPGEPQPTPYSRYCIGTDLDTLRIQGLWHEGAVTHWTSDHHQVQVTFYQNTDVMHFMEAAWVPLIDPVDQRPLIPRLRTLDSLQWGKTLLAQQAIIDSKNPGVSPAPIAAPNCKLRPYP